MWRFVEPGPRLKFPLRESPFMQADPMYRDVVVAPPIRFARVAPRDPHPRSTAADAESLTSASRSTETVLPRSSPSAPPHAPDGGSD
jgi:hypothetical protein